MAHESTMTPIRSECAQTMGDAWSSLTVLSSERMLSSLGNNLRDVYGTVVDSAQPGDLMRLAALIDERRGLPDA